MRHPTPRPTAKRCGPRSVILEPGRVVVGNAAVLLSRVILVKDADTKRFVVTDAGMNDLIRPTLYEAHHEIDRCRGRDESAPSSTFVGPVCENGDFLAQDRELPALEAGELVAVRAVGAYGFSSNDLQEG